MNIEWKFADDPIEESVIKGIQKKLGIAFPEDYIQCAIRNHGGSPRPKVYDFSGRKEAVFGSLLSFDEHEPTFILDVYDAIGKRLPDKVIPFADDPFGNYLCFDFRDKESNPTVVFWDHEQPNRKTSLSKVCNNFTELLNKLYKPDWM